MNYSNSIVKVKNILARVIRGWSVGKELSTISADPTPKKLQVADKMMLISAMPETVVALESKKPG